MEIIDKFFGCLAGSAVGDAIGELAFRRKEKSALLKAVDQEALLRYTDDTAMSIGLAEYLVDKGTVQIEELGQVFKNNFQREPWRGYGAGPLMIFRLVEEGLSFENASISLFQGQGSYGNGASMRVAPVGLLFYDSPLLLEMAERASRVTHSHEIACDGARVIVTSIAFCLPLEKLKPFPGEELIERLNSVVKTKEWEQKLILLKKFLHAGMSPEKACKQLGCSVAAHESVPFAVYAFLTSPDSFKECLFNAVLSGRDRDTLGAMACAISGSYLGSSAIPEKWLKKIEKRTLLHDLSLRLAEKRR